MTSPATAKRSTVGDIELRLDASITAADTGWIVILQDISPDGSTYEVTGGWVRASLRSSSRLLLPALDPTRRRSVD